MRSLIWLEERTAKLVAESDGDRRLFRMPLATLPQVAPPSGVNFAEIKAEDTSQLELLLTQLGFESRGEHRTKPVSLWTLGEARIILNRQQARGVDPAISAPGFDVENALTAVARAVQLKAVPVPRPSQANEEVLLAVTAPDGTEVFLCQDAVWTEEFGESGAGGELPSSAAAPAHIDHVNLAQPWQHYDEAVLFYSSVLALRPQPSQDVSSPAGLVRSQVMQGDDRRVRLALNLAPWVQADRVRGTVRDTF